MTNSNHMTRNSRLFAILVAALIVGVQTAVFAASGPDISVSLTNGVADVAPDGTYIYTATVSNIGGQVANAVTVTQQLPANVTVLAIKNGGTANAQGLVTWPAFALNAGDTVLRQLQVKLNNPLPAGTPKTLTSVATAFASGDTNSQNNTATYSSAIVASPNLSVKITDGLTTINTGSNTTMMYTVTASNIGNIGSTGVVATATIPANTSLVAGSITNGGSLSGQKITWPAFALNGGDSVIRQFTLKLNDPLPAGSSSTLTTKAAVDDDHANGTDCDLTNNTACDVDCINGIVPSNFDLSIAITDGLDTINPSETMIYTLTVCNVGNIEAKNVLVKGTIPANTTVVPGSITNGGTIQGDFVVWPTFTLAAQACDIRQYTLKLADTLPNPPPVNLLVTGTVSGDAGEKNLDNNTATDCDNIVIPPTTINLSITQCNNLTGCAPAGSTVKYNLTIGNLSTSVATGVLVQDTIPPGTDFVSASDGGTFSSTTGMITWPLFTLNGGDSTIRSFTILLKNPIPSGIVELVNYATVTDDGTHGPDKCQCNNKTTLKNPICTPTPPDLAITKSVDVPCVTANATLTYTLTATTQNANPASGVVITDTIPANTTYVSSSNGGTFANGVVTFPAFTLAGNSTALRTVVVKFAAAVPQGLTAVSNVVSITDDHSNGPDSNPSDNTFTLTTPICNPPDLEIVSDDPAPCFSPGSNVTYTLSASSKNAVPSTGVVIKDTIPAFTSYVSSSNGGTFANGVVTFPAFTLDGNSTAIRTVTLLISPSVPANTVFVNLSSVSDDGAHGAESNKVNNAYTSNIKVCAAPDLAITKSVTVPCATLGASLTYTISAQSLNANPATGVVVTDTIPANTTYVSSSNGGTFANGVVTFPAFALAGNSTAIRTVTVNVASTVPAGVANLTNVVSITDDHSNGLDSNPSDNTFTLTTPICTQNPPDLAIIKSVDVPCVSANATLTYTLVASTKNANPATGVVVTDTIPANTTFVSASNGGTFANGVVTFPAFALAGNSTAIRTVVVKFAASVPQGLTTVSNTVNVTDDGSHGPDSNPSDNTYTLDTPICTQNPPDLAITKSVTVPCATLGASLTYTITAQTLNANSATGVVVTDTIPANTTYVSSSNGGTFSNGVVTFPAFALAGNSTAIRTVTVAVSPTVPSGVTAISNVVMVTDDHSNGPDSNPSNNTFTLTTPICTQNPPDLAIIKSIDVPCVSANATLTYTLVASTKNANPATGVVVTDSIPANTTFVSASNGGTFANGVVTFPAFSLAGNSTAIRTVVVKFAASVPQGVTTVSNTATVTDDGSHGPDSNPSDNTYKLDTPICTQNPPDLAITKSVTVPCATLGASLTYTITAQTLNANPATGVVITDSLPANTAYVSSSNGGTFANGVVTFPAFALAGNSTAIRTVTVTVATTVPSGVANLTNVVAVTDDHSNGPDSNPSNNTFTLTTPICTPTAPDLAVSKSVTVSCVTPGSSFTYTLTASTLNSVAVTGVIVADTLPANTTYIASSNGGTFANGVVTFPAFALAGNSSVTRTITVAVNATIPSGVTSVVNVATIHDDGTHGTDSNTSNNTFSLTTPICTPQGNDLMIEINSSHICANLIDTYTYTLKVSNASGNALTGLIVRDTIPPNATFVSASDGGTLNTATGVVTFPTFNLPDITTVIRTVTVRLQLPLVPPAIPISLVNSATVTDDGSNGGDTNVANNSATVTTLVSNLHFVSDPSGQPNPVITGIPEVFSAVAQDDAFPTAPITYAWDFGDGTTGSGAMVTHTYPSALTGPFTITLTVSNGIGCPIGFTLNRDSSGNNQSAECQLFKAPFSLVKPNADSLTLVAQVTLPKGFNTAGHTVSMNIANFAFKATLDLHGNGVALPSNQKVHVKANGDFSIVTLKITKSNLRTLLAPGVPTTAKTAALPNQLFVITFDANANASSFGLKENINYKSNLKNGVISF